MNSSEQGERKCQGGTKKVERKPGRRQVDEREEQGPDKALHSSVACVSFLRQQSSGVIAAYLKLCVHTTINAQLCTPREAVFTNELKDAIFTVGWRILLLLLALRNTVCIMDGLKKITRTSTSAPLHRETLESPRYTQHILYSAAT